MAPFMGAGRGTALVYGKANPTFCCESGDMGLHRLKDPAGDGSFTSIETLHLLQGDEGGHSDHGVHDPVLSPDGRHLYMVNGNRTYYPAVMSPLSPVRHNRDDRVIPILSGGGGRGGAAAAAHRTHRLPATAVASARPRPRQAASGLAAGWAAWI